MSRREPSPDDDLVRALGAVVSPEATEATFDHGSAVERIATEAGLGPRRPDDVYRLGRALGTALAERDLVVAEQLVWTQLANVQRAYLCDLYEVATMSELGPLCAGFVGARVEALRDGDPKRARREGEALATTWTIRLTGYPLLYDYVERDEVVHFARAQLSAVLDGLDPPADAREAAWASLVDSAVERVSCNLFSISAATLGAPLPVRGAE